MQKRGQVSILIIFAVVALIIVGITYFVRNQYYSSDVESTLSKLGISNQASIVESSIIDCLQLIAEESEMVIGLQGGYYNQPTKSESVGFIFIPYYYYQGEYLQPSKTKVETELSAYVDDNLEVCVDNLNFTNFKILFDKSNSQAIIRDNQISFKTDLTLIIEKDELIETINLNDHSITIESSLLDIMEVATYITNSHKEYPDFMCASCVSEMAEERNLYLDFLNFDNGKEENVTLIVISENKTDIEPYVFEFLNKY